MAIKTSLAAIAAVSLLGGSFAAVAFEGDVSLAQQLAVTRGDQTVVLERVMPKYKRPDSIPFPEENPYTEAKWDLGKALYFDPRLSKSNIISCATCHNPSLAWGDGLARGVGHGTNELARRSPTILNGAWGEVFMWDGRFDTLEEQAMGPITSEAEMAMSLDDLLPKLEKITEYRDMFAAAFDGSTEITAEKIAIAIATYERTVVSGEAPFDRWINGDDRAISAAAKRGFELFNGKANCVACHSSWRFTDDSFHDIGLNDGDIGRGAQLPKIEKMQHAFKTPGLRNIDRRGPYMHNGSLSTLAEVIEHYDRAGIVRPSRSDEIYPLNLTAQEKRDLEEFLGTLTSDDAPVTFVQLPR